MRIPVAGVDPAERTCRSCGETKPLNFFRQRKEKPHLWEWSCKQCRSRQCREQPNRIQTVERFKASPKGRRGARRGVVGRYGLTVEQYDAMVEAVGGVCEICGQPETRRAWGVVRSLSVDHCHISDRVRGILCDDCNVALGRVGDSIAVLEAMIGYLKERGA